ncbi:MAG TPA: hypothetical protein VGM06_26205 [Polyangiaceae bacterium]
MLAAEITQFDGFTSSLTIERRSLGVVVLTITGRDIGEHGDGPLEELDLEAAKAPFSLFIDASKTRGASVDVSDVWAQWLRKNRDRLHRIHMLTGSRFVRLTADFVRRFADLGDAMFIYTDGRAFEEALDLATRR